MSYIDRFHLTDDYSIARLIVGGWQFSIGHTSRTLRSEHLVDHLVRLVELGYTTFDCADIYRGVEELYGRLLRALRNTSLATPIQIHTKFVPDASTLATIDGPQIERIIDRSLRRLGVERLDLVQFHWWNYDVHRYVEIALHLVELQRVGKIRLIGATNFDTDHLQELLDAGIPVVSNQVQYSLIDRRAERTLTALCIRRNVHLIAYGALADGFLSRAWMGQPDPTARTMNRSLVKYRLIIDECGGWDAFQKLLRELFSLTDDGHIAGLVLGFVLNKPAVAGLAVGIRNLEHGMLNAKAARQLLTERVHTHLRQLVSEMSEPAGDVYGLERIRNGPHGRIMRYELQGPDE